MMERIHFEDRAYELSMGLPLFPIDNKESTPQKIV